MTDSAHPGDSPSEEPVPPSGPPEGSAPAPEPAPNPAPGQSPEDENLDPDRTLPRQTTPGSLSDGPPQAPIPPRTLDAPPPPGTGAAASAGMATPPGLWQAPSVEELNIVLPDFEILEMLGRGGMGAVYKGIQKSLDRPVAIKVLPPELSQDLEFEARFAREAKAMARLNHPNIIQIYDFGQTQGGHYYFVMEFVDGADLHQLIRNGHLNPEAALKVVIQICEALQYAHEKGYVHRDIKPANILLTAEGVVKVGDFGLAKLVDPEQGSETEQLGLTLTGVSMGTPLYMAPEQMHEGAEIDHRADIYSLGVMFYEMLTGSVPRGAFDPPSGKIQVDVRIDDVVLKAMHEHPERRYQSAREVETDVEIIRTNPKGATLAGLERKGKKNPQVRRPKPKPAPTMVGPQNAGSAGSGDEPKKGLPVGALVTVILLLLLGLGGGGAWWWLNQEGKLPAFLAQKKSEGAGETSNSTTGKGRAGTPDPPRIELPAKLAAMKERGGRLRSWGEWKDEAEADEFQYDLQGVAHMADFVDVSYASPGWLAHQGDGTSWAGQGDELWDRSNVRVFHNKFRIDSDDKVYGRHNSPWGMAMFRGITEGVKDGVGANNGMGIFLMTDGRVKTYGPLDPDGWKEGSYPEIKRKLEALSGVVEITGGAYCTAVLQDTGDVIGWSPKTGIFEWKAPPERRAVSIRAAGGWVAVLLEDGDVEIVHAEGKEVHEALRVPDDLPPVYRLRTQSDLIAAQLADGTWRAWGTAPQSRIDRIHQLGPAVDLTFWGSGGGFGLIWIEPAEAGRAGTPDPPQIELPPQLAALKERGGKLRSWPADRFNKLDAARQEGLTDLVTVRAHSTGHWAGIRKSGESLSSLTAFHELPEVADVVLTMGAMGNQSVLRNRDGSLITVSDFASEGEPVTSQVKGYAAGWAHYFLLADGSLQLRPMPKSTGVEWKQGDAWKSIQRTLAQQQDLVAVAAKNEFGLALRRDGKVLAWDLKSGGFAEPPAELPELVEIACGHGYYAALSREGTVFVWTRAGPLPDTEWGKKMTPPPDLGKVFALRASGGVLAAQQADGRWRAWGVEREDAPSVIAQINQLGPALDVSFYAPSRAAEETNTKSGLLWIEQAETATQSSAVPPRVPRTKPGRLRSVLLGKKVELNLGVFEGVDDLIQLQSGYGRDARVFGLRQGGEVVTNKKEFGGQNARWLTDRLGSSLTSAYITQEGKARALHGNGLQNGVMPEVDRPIVEMATTHDGGITLLANGQAIPWGFRYDPDPSDKRGTPPNSPWKRPLEEELQNVIEVSSTRDFDAVLRRDGSLFAWDHVGALEIPSEVASGVKQIHRAGSGQALFVLMDSGTLYTYRLTEDSRESQVSEIQEGVIAVKGGRGQLPNTYQTEDGAWHCLGITSLGETVGSELEAALRHVHGLPAEAFLINGGGGPEPYAWLLWIEPAAETTTTNPAAATREQPFANSLGMTFVPVPIGHGPKAGPQVLFCRHETRWKDYAAYADGKEGLNDEWKKQLCFGYDVRANEERPEDHPVTMLTLDESREFCEWLTKKEQTAGRLPAGFAYRLPTDLEWSWAAGIGDREDPGVDPAAKVEQMSGRGLEKVYPWKGSWPPPPGAANVSDESRNAEAAYPNGTSGGFAKGYNDGYPATSPVMAFVPNALGIFDLGGNVRERIDEEFGGKGEEVDRRRMLRGGSWSCLPSTCVAAYRSANSSDNRVDSIGFRVVLAKMEPYSLSTKPGRLRGVGTRRLMGPGKKNGPLDLSAAEGLTDLVQIVDRFPGGQFGVLRANGEVVPSWEGFDAASGIRRMGQRGGSDPNLFYLDEEGRAVPGNTNQRLRIWETPPAVDRPIVDVANSNQHGLLLLDDGRALAWGRMYDDEEWIARTPAVKKVWPRPPEAELRGVRAIAVCQKLAVVLREDGSVYAWNGDGVLPLPSDFQSGIQALAMSEMSLGVLNRDDRLFVVSTQGERLTRLERGGVVALSVRGTTPLYQTADGNWHFLSPQIEEKYPEVFAALPNLKGLPPEAFTAGASPDIPDNPTYLLWIEPVE